MEHYPASRPNVVPLFFGIATAAVLITVLGAALFFNKLSQPQPTDPALIAQSQQPGYSYTEAAATETVHNKALLILIAVGSMAAAAITGMLIISNITNRRILREMARFNQHPTSNIPSWQYQEAYTVDKSQIIRANRTSRKAYYSRN